MAETEPSDALAQRVIIRFLVFEGVKPAEILRRLTDQFGEQTMKKSRVYAWCARFKDGRESVMDNGRGGSEAKVVNDMNISNVEKLILTNKQITVREIAEKTSMSVGSVEKIIHNHLHFRKSTTGWVPKRVKQRQEKA